MSFENERLLNGSEVRGVGREEEQLTAARRQGLPNAGGFVDAQVIEHDDLSRSQCWPQLLADVPGKRRCIHRAFNQPRFAQAVGGEGGHQRRILAVVAWYRTGCPLVMRRPTIEPGQGRVGAAFVDKDQLCWVKLGDCRAPRCARFLVALACCQ